jgi:hypothetical protein
LSRDRCQIARRIVQSNFIIWPELSVPSQAFYGGISLGEIINLRLNWFEMMDASHSAKFWQFPDVKSGIEACE